MNYEEFLDYADYCDLTLVEVTQGTNGYPKGLYKVATNFESYEEAKIFADEVGGEVISIHKKAGWQLWESEGYHPSPYDMYAHYAMQDNIQTYEPHQYNDELSFIETEDVEGYLCNLYSFEQIQRNLDFMKEIWQKIETAGEDEVICANFDTYYVWTEERCRTQYTDDVHTYMIAVTHND